jgi:uncharacterized membrane protein
MKEQMRQSPKIDDRPFEQARQDETQEAERALASHEALRAKIQEISAFSGPLPPPEILDRYNAIIPNGADRLLRLVELQSEHRRSCEATNLNSSISIAKRGQLFAFILSLFGLFSAIFCAYIRQPVPSSIIGGGTLLGLASLFIKGRRQNKTEP